VAPETQPLLLEPHSVAFWNKKKETTKPTKLAVKARTLLKKKGKEEGEKVVPPLDEEDLSELEEGSPLGGKTNHRWQNWAQIFACTPKYYYEPPNKQEVLQILKL